MSLTKIPRNIFQTWETKELSSGFLKLTQTWKDKNLNYSYFLFDSNDRENFIKKHFSINVYNAYNRIIPGAFKADLWRYCVLYIFGGVYIDIDTICINSIDKFLNEDVEFITPVDLNNCSTIGTHNLFCSFIASIPKHPILLNCINRIVSNVENNIIPFSNLDFSGPGILGRSTNTFLNLNEETSFIGKEGYYCNQTLQLLHFDYGSEYVRDNFNILFQNKNGNKEIQDIYNNETLNINHIDWGTCKNPIKPLTNMNNLNDVTIVTMFYDIRKKENYEFKEDINHSANRYFDFAKEFILTLPYNLIIFTDCEECIQLVNKERKHLLNKTHIYIEPFEETYYFKYYNTLCDLRNKYFIINGNKTHETPMYIILNNNKFDCIENAILSNPFQSSHFVWMDFGINHVAKNTEIIHNWIQCVPDKIKQMCINPYLESDKCKDFFKFIYHHTAGGLFSGSAVNLLQYCELFKNKTEQIYREEWYQIDEAVMTIVQRENPTLFNFYYGDYQGIISNYLTPIHNIDLILNGSQKCIDYKNNAEAYNILCYCNKYFLENNNNGLVFQFIQQHIIVDYYINNKLLVDDIIYIINKLISNNNNNILQLLQANHNNLNFYSNKQLIKKL